MKSLYTICLNHSIFEKTGRECISTFFKTDVQGDLFVGYEGGDELKLKILSLADESSAGSRLILHDLDKNSLLNKVLEENKDVIPEDYGGTNAEMNRGSVPENQLVALGAKKYFRYRASKWWRVFATLDAAAKQPDYDYVIQIDADVAFVKPISQDKINLEMANNAVLYHEGPFRKSKTEDGLVGIGVETSFTGYSKHNGGYDIIYKLMDKLVSKDFKNYERWDDSFLLSKIIDEESYECRDASGDDHTPDSDVVDRGPFKDYICHFKGLNGGCGEAQKKYETYLNDKNKHSESVKLNLACGEMYLEGYINIDDNSHGGYRVDKRANVFELDYEANSVDEVLLSHFMMYVDREAAPAFISKIYKWLKPEGKLVVETGDLKAVCRNILANNSAEYLDGFQGIRQLFGWQHSCCHKWAWCEENLKPIFEEAGFNKIVIERGIYHNNPERDFLIEGTK
tara:strand:- start:10359 stop:11723 length:1365 start_codon:yes stop_codon:yes gene_type:complete